MFIFCKPHEVMVKARQTNLHSHRMEMISSRVLPTMSPRGAEKPQTSQRADKKQVRKCMENQNSSRPGDQCSTAPRNHS